MKPAGGGTRLFHQPFWALLHDLEPIAIFDIAGAVHTRLASHEMMPLFEAPEQRISSTTLQVLSATSPDRPPNWAYSATHSAISSDAPERTDHVHVSPTHRPARAFSQPGLRAGHDRSGWAIALRRRPERNGQHGRAPGRTRSAN
ncbi:hypothetical protein [Cryobacterium suzukii]|uniref:TY-Chap2 family putative peptide chaperone n=1 Tax=Cryobacterium suzukii TaxID=1259198 RepID=UPI003B96B218